METKKIEAVRATIYSLDKDKVYLVSFDTECFNRELSGLNDMAYRISHEFERNGIRAILAVGVDVKEIEKVNINEQVTSE